MNGSENQIQNTPAPPMSSQEPAPAAAASRESAPPSSPSAGYFAGPAMSAGVRGQDSRAKSPGLAGFLSLIPGLGQIYVGYYTRGFVHAGVVAVLFSALVNVRDEGMIPIFLLPMIFFWLYNVIDAIRRASMYNLYLAGEQEIELPQDFQIPSFGGSLFGGLVLMVSGVALLAHTRFDVSLDWVLDWWPVGPILLGVYLFVTALQERAAAGPSESR